MLQNFLLEIAIHNGECIGGRIGKMQTPKGYLET